MASYKKNCTAPGMYGSGTCGAEFTAKRSDARTCSARCRKRAHSHTPKARQARYIAGLRSSYEHHAQAATYHAKRANDLRAELVKAEANP